MFFFQRNRKGPLPPGTREHPSTFASTLETTLVGRRYRTDIPYLLPKDVHETNRLDFQHFLLRQVLKGNYVAPLTSPQHILDVGSGTGRWALELSQEFPEAKVVGVDMEVPTLPPSPESHVRFVQANILKGVPFPDASFDFVHQRFLVTALPALCWPPLIEDLIRVTSGGGWIELVEVTHLIAPCGPAGQQMATWIEEMCNQRGIDPLLPQRLGTLLKASLLLEDVHFLYLDLPVGDWGQRVGSLLAKDYSTVYEGVKPLYQQQLHISSSTFDRVLKEMREEWETFQSTSRVYVAYGKRKS